MLKLIRKIGEEIYIDKGKIKIIFLNEKDGLIILGIKAPRYIDIERKEIFIRKHIEQHERFKEKRKLEAKK